MLVWGCGELIKEPYRPRLTKKPEEISRTICTEMSFSFLRKILLKTHMWMPTPAQCIRDCLQSLKSAVQVILVWTGVKVYSKGCKALKSSGDRNEKQALNYVLRKGRYLGKILLSLGKYYSLLVQGKSCSISNVISKLICSERLKEIIWKSIYYTLFTFSCLLNNQLLLHSTWHRSHLKWQWKAKYPGVLSPAPPADFVQAPSYDKTTLLWGSVQHLKPRT